MPITVKELREKRAALVRDARTILDKADAEKRQVNAEERGKWAAIMGDLKRDDSGAPILDAQGKEQRVIGETETLKNQIDQMEIQERAELDLRQRIETGTRPGKEDGVILGEDHVIANGRADDKQFSTAMQAWFMCQEGIDLRQEHMDACKATGVNPRRRDIGINIRQDHYRNVKRDCRAMAAGTYERRAGSNAAQSGTLNTGGAYTIAEGFVNNLEIALLQYGGIREVADVIRTASGNDLPWPTVNDTTVTGTILAESQAITASDMTFGVVVYHAYKFTSGLVLVPVELIEDSAFNLASTVGDLLGVRIGRGQSNYFTTGTGAGQPWGIMNAATSGITAASPTALAADDLYGLKHSVDPSYRKGAVWMMHDNILLALKKLKDGMGRYLWQASLAGGTPDTIDNDPIHINQSMASALSGTNRTVLYGDASKYKIRDVSEVRLRRLVERYADQDQEGYVMFMRGDGNLLDAGTHPVKYIKQS